MRFYSKGSVSWNGVEFKPDDDDIVEVPFEARAVMESHGLAPVDESKVPAPKGAPPPSDLQRSFMSLRSDHNKLTQEHAHLRTEHQLLREENAALIARVRQLEAMSGPATDDPENTNASAPKFGAMTVDQMQNFSDEHELGVDLKPGSILVKRTAMDAAWKAKLAKAQAAETGGNQQ